MKVAVISDIHGNLVALDAVLADINAEQVDRIVCLGDVAAAGPQPSRTVERLRPLDLPTVMGNTDAIVLKPDELVATLQKVDEGDPFRRNLQFWLWGSEQLSAEQKRYIETFKPTVNVSLDAGRAMCCYHGSPASYDDPILPTTPAEEVEGLLAGHSADVMVGGHTHHQMVRRVGRTLVVNPGSVGASSNEIQGWPPVPTLKRAAWAEYAIIRSDGGKLGVDLRRIPFDVNAVIDAILTSGMPNAESIADSYR